MLVKSATIATLILMLASLVLVTGCGERGVGIESIVNNHNGTFTLNLTDGSSFTTDNLTGPKGPAAPVGQWHGVIASFSGIGNKQSTDSFYVAGNLFRCIWMAQPTNSAILSDSASFACIIHPSGDNITIVGSIGGPEAMQSFGAGVEYIYSGSGQFYFDVFAAGLSSWAVYVESYY